MMLMYAQGAAAVGIADESLGSNADEADEGAARRKSKAMQDTIEMMNLISLH